MKRKILATVLSFTMIAAMLSGCGASQQAAAPAAEAPAAEEAAPAAEEAAPAAEEAAPAAEEAAPAAEEAAPAADAAAASDPAVELTFTSVSVTGDSHTTAMDAFAEKVAELSGGSVTCKTYADGTLFSADAEWDALTTGQADLAYISFPTLATQSGLEWCSMVGSAYFWSSYDHMTNTLNGDIGKNDIFPKIESAVNAVPLSAFYLGSRVVNTRNKEINAYKDMNGVLLRMPNSETWLNLGEALGANPTPLAFSELYTALQTGAVDGQDNPLPTDVSAKFYEVAPYVAITNHVVDSIIPMINKDKWNSLTDAQKQAVTDAMEYAKGVNDDARIEEEEKDIAILEENGCTITYPDIEDFKTNAQKYYEDHPDQTADWDMDLYKKIQDAAK
ncbi:MAG: sialic acid TRAP transporter substrate-binding protein SiaP [Lachnospiraceae bacterium]|nr:sialic acid TRAP transporter substrate-binding protein SiaP [Lachnospiraceae bacterium]